MASIGESMPKSAAFTWGSLQMLALHWERLDAGVMLERSFAICMLLSIQLQPWASFSDNSRSYL